MLLCLIKLLFCNVFIDFLFYFIVDQLFLGSINTLDFTNYLAERGYSMEREISQFKVWIQ